MEKFCEYRERILLKLKGEVPVYTICVRFFIHGSATLKFKLKDRKKIQKSGNHWDWNQSL